MLGLAGAGLALWRLERGRMGGPAARAWASLFLALVVFVAVGWPGMAGLFERGVLLSPALVRRAATGRARTPEERWILGQSKAVRESFVREVLDAPGDPVVLQQIWMMRQPDAVRESYVREVLEPTLG